jgi:hypothetical protein
LACPACKSANVYEFFTEQLGHPPTDETLKELLITDPCGRDCMKVIMAARLYMILADPHPGVTAPLLTSVDCAVGILWHG